MIYRVIFDPGAEADLDAIFDYVADKSGVERAYNLVEGIRRHCLGFDLNPERGTRRDNLRPGVRVVGYRRRASIVFTIKEREVLILGIYYGGRNYAVDFNDDNAPRGGS